MAPSLPATLRSWWASTFRSPFPGASEPQRPDFATPNAIGEAVLDRRRQDERDLLAERMRIGLLVTLVTGVGIAVGIDPVLHADEMWLLIAAKLAQVPIVVWVWRQTRSASRGRLVCAFALMEIVTAAVTCFSSIVVGEAWSAPVFAILIVSMSAGLLPWGTRAQLASGPVVLLLGLVPALILGDGQILGLMAALSAVVGIASVLVAREQERYRRAAWRSLVFFRENMERLRQIAEHIHGVLWLGELGDGGESFLYVSPRYDAVWGLDRRELRERPRAWLDAVHPDDRAAVEARAAAALRDPEQDDDATSEYRLVQPGGAIRWIRDYTFPIRDVEGRARRIARLSQDVTSEKEAASAQRMRELARSVHATREEERRRIARELHDELGQALTGIKLRLAGALMAGEAGATVEPGAAAGAGAADADRAVATSAMRACIADVDVAMGSLRSLIHQLHPPVLDEVGLVAALRMQAQSFASRTGIPCDLDVPESEPELSGEELATVFRVAQESLTNVARHAQASHVAVQLCAWPTALRLVVADDGCGIAGAKRGFGLRGMAERAAVLNGTLRVEPRPQRGTIVQLEIPRPAGGGCA